MFKPLAIALAVSLSFCQMAASCSAAVIISEFMYEVPGVDDLREWVELYNTGDTAVDLSGWRMFDEDAGSQPGSLLAPGTILNARQTLVLIEDEATFVAEWQRPGIDINYVVYPGMGTGLNLANAGTAVGDEVIQLVDADGNLVDAVDYMNSSPFPSVTNATGTAIYLQPNFLDPTLNDLGSSWARATDGVDGAYLVLDGEGIESASPGFVVEATAVPEPVSASLLGVAAIGLAVRSRRKAARRA